MKDCSKNKEIRDYLFDLYKDAKCELNYSKDYELLLAVILSAQCSDKKVNEIDKILFTKYDSLDKLNNASFEDIKKIIEPLGLANNKAIAIKDAVNKLINDYNYKVPSSKEELLKIKGVGNKVANVVLIELFNKNEFPVDTHIYRFSKRLGYIKETDSILKAEQVLKDNFNEEDYIPLHHKIIYFGRYKCKSINPICKDCKIKKYCVFNKNK